MNEFTKEELEYLHHTIDNIVECYSEPDIAYLVRDKIQHLIETYDNPEYCAHSGVKLEKKHG
jgi:hypothetical protein